MVCVGVGWAGRTVVAGVGGWGLHSRCGIFGFLQLPFADADLFIQIGERRRFPLRASGTLIPDDEVIYVVSGRVDSH